MYSMYLSSKKILVSSNNKTKLMFEIKVLKLISNFLISKISTISSVIKDITRKIFILAKIINIKVVKIVASFLIA